MRKMFCVMMTLAAIVCFIPVVLSAQFSGGTGVIDDPWLVGTPHDVFNMRSCNNAYYLQICDIDLDVAPFNQGGGWVSIGGTSSTWTFYYNGDGYSIANLWTYTSYHNSDPRGLFNTLNGGYVRNLNLVDVDFQGIIKGGALAWSISGTLIENCNVNGVISPDEDYPGQDIGGLIGVATNQSSINHCSAQISINNHDGGFTGGIVGRAIDSEIENCWAWVNLGSGDIRGGLAGKIHNSTVSYCWTGGIINGGSEDTGALIGEISASQVNGCFSRIDMSTDWGASAAFAGKAHSGSVISNCYTEVSFEGSSEDPISGFIWDSYGAQLINCYSRAIQNTNDCIAPITLTNYDTVITSCYYNRDLMVPTYGIDNPECARTSELMSWPHNATYIGTYVGWDFDNVWQMDVNHNANYGYPLLRGMDYSHLTAAPRFNWFPGYYDHTLDFMISCSSPNAQIYYTLDGSTPDLNSQLYTGPFLISTEVIVKARAFADGLFSSSISVGVYNGHVSQLSGSGTMTSPYLINSEYSLYEINSHMDSYFKLTGNISIYEKHYPSDCFVPIGRYFGPDSPLNRPFTGSLDGNHFTIFNSGLASWNTLSCGLFAYCEGAQVSNLVLKFDGVNGSGHTGALAGVIVDSDILRCYARGPLQTDSGDAGMLIGRAINSDITQCWSSGTLAGGNDSGGLVGKMIGGSATDCFSVCDVTAGERAGGLIGVLQGNPVVQNCYSAGMVNGDGPGFGGLIGISDSDQLNSCYWDMQSSGQNSSAGGTGCTTDQMQNLATYEGWNFGSIWFNPTPSINYGYPKLRNNSGTPSSDELAPAAPQMSLWPNPFQQNLKLRLDLPGRAKTELCIYNARGQRVRSLISDYLSPGSHELNWDAKDEHGHPVASGIYLIKIDIGESHQCHKVLLLK